jgi:hypothetical protein
MSARDKPARRVVGTGLDFEGFRFAADDEPYCILGREPH